MSKHNQTLEASRFLKVLGNPYRLQIVQQLSEGEKNVSALNSVVKVSQPALSQHLSKLKRAGVLGCRRNQREIFYFVSNPHALRALGLAIEATAV